MPTPTVHYTPFKMTEYPASVTLHRVGAYHYAGNVTVVDTGKVAINVKMTGVSLGASGRGCVTPGGQPSWLHLASTSFRLQPNQSRVVDYVVSAPHSVTGSSAIVASGTPVVHGKGAQLAGAIGSRITLGNDRCAIYHAAAAPVAHSSSPVGIIVLLVLLAALIAVLAVVGRKVAVRRAAR
jgi:hypothetical protein